MRFHALTRAFLMAFSLGCAASSQGASADTFPPPLVTPRLAPIQPQDGNAEQRAYITGRVNYNTDYNIFKTFAHHLTLVRALDPLGLFALKQSNLPPRERELVILRMGWLCQSPYEWSQHARIAKYFKALTDVEIHRVAEGPDAPGWTDAERVILRMVDELRYGAAVSDATWQALRATHSDQLVMELLITAGQYQLVSMFLNSLGVQLDASLTDRLPTDVKAPALAARPLAPRPAQPRIAAVAQAQATLEPNLHATMAAHPQLYAAWVQFDRYVQRDALLPPQTRELLLLRTAWNTRDAYGWAYHYAAAKAAGLADADVARVAAGPSANGWNEEQAALLRAADGLHREAFISDADWRLLFSYYDKKQLVDIIVTVGGGAMSGLVANSLGVQVESGYPAMPND